MGSIVQVSALGSFLVMVGAWIGWVDVACPCRVINPGRNHISMIFFGTADAIIKTPQL